MAAKIRIPIEVEIKNLEDIPELEDKLKSFGSIAQTATEAAKKYSQEDQIRWAQYQKAITTSLKGAMAAQNEYISNLQKMFNVSAKMADKESGVGKLTNKSAYSKEINSAIKEYAQMVKDAAQVSEEAQEKINTFWMAFSGRTSQMEEMNGKMAATQEGIRMLTSHVLELAEAGKTEGEEVGKTLNRLEEYRKELDALQKAEAEEAFRDFNRTINEQAEYFASTGRELEGLQKKYQALNQQILKNIQTGQTEHNEELVASLNQVSGAIEEITSREQTLNFDKMNTMADVMETLGENSEAVRTRSKALKDEIIRLSLALKDLKEDEDANREKIQRTETEIERLTQQYRELNTTASGIKAWAQNFGSLITYVLKYRIALSLVRDTWRKFTQTVKESMEVAASAEQVYNKLTTAFDNYNASMREAIELSGKLGTATTTAAESLSTMGDILQGQGMSKNASLAYASQWTRQLADIIAFKDLNMTLNEFSSSFMSGAAGNTRNFRQFGSIVKETMVEARLLKDGLADLTGEELELAKMVTRATLALEQQANSEGAVVREWNTVLSVNRRLSESWKEWKENLGDVVNQGLHPFKQALAEILESANNVKRIRDALKNETKLRSAFDITNPQDEALMADMFSVKTHINWGATTLGSTNNSSIEYPANDIDELVRKMYTLSATYKDLEKYFEKSGQPGLTDWLHNLATEEEVIEKMAEYAKYADAPEKFAYAWNDAVDAMGRAEDQLDTINTILKGFTSVGDYAAGNDFTDKDSIEHIIGLTHVGAEGNEEAALKDMVDLYSKLQTAISKTKKEQESMTSALLDMEQEFKNRYGTSANMRNFSGRTTDAYGNALTEDDYKEAEAMIAQINTLRTAISDANSDIISFETNLADLSPIVAGIYSKSLIENVSKVSDEYDGQIKSLKLEARFRAENIDATDEEINLLVQRQEAMDALDATYKEQYSIISLLQDNEQALADLEAAREQAESNINAYYEERIRLQKEADEAAREKERLDTIRQIVEKSSEYGDSARENLAILQLEQKVRRENGNLSEDELDIEIERKKAIRETENEYAAMRKQLEEQKATQEELDKLDTDKADAIQAQNDLYDKQLEILQEETAELTRQQGISTMSAIRSSALSSIQDRASIASYMAQPGMTESKANVYLNRDKTLQAGLAGLRDAASGIEGADRIISSFDVSKGPNALKKLLADEFGDELPAELQKGLEEFASMWNSVSRDVKQTIDEIDAEIEETRQKAVDGILDSSAKIVSSARENLFLLQEEQRIRGENKDLEDNEVDVLIARYNAVYQVSKQYDDIISQLREQKASDTEIAKAEKDKADAIQAQNDLYDKQLERVKEINASALVQSRLGAAQSYYDFKQGISPKEYSGDYAEVDQWFDDITSQLSVLLSDMYEAGYSIEEINALRTESMGLIYEENEARRKAIDAEKEAAKKEYIKNTGMRLAGGTVGGIMQAAAEGMENGGIWGAILSVAVEILERFGVMDELYEMIDESIETTVKPLMPMVSSITSATRAIIAPVMKAIETPIKIIATVITTVSGIIEGIATAIDWMTDNFMTFFRNVGKIVYNAFHPFNQKSLDSYRSWEDLVQAELDVTKRTAENVYKIWHNQESEKSLDDSYIKAIQEMMEKGILTDLEGMGLISDYLGAGAWSNTLAPVDASGNYMKDYASGVVDNSTNTYNFTINGSGLSKEELVEAMIEYYKRIEVTKGTPTTYIGAAYA